ncbi:MAG: mycoredoxin [Anaerolineales bacterium]|nr:mycoredoxin [Anaerolineales bacterium]
MNQSETAVKAQIQMYTTSWCPDCHRAKYVLNEYGIAYAEIDVEQDEAGLAFVKQVNNGRRVVPTIVFPDGSILVEPSNHALANKLGIEM